jgi:predicted Zn-dependent protease
MFTQVLGRKLAWCAQPRAPVVSRLFLVTAMLASTLSCSLFRNPDAAAKSLLERGKADRDARRYSDAAREFREAVRLQPGNPAGHYWLGITLRDMGQRDEAMAELYRAHLVQSFYSDSVLLLAQMMVRSEDIQYVKWSADHAHGILARRTDPASRSEAYYILGLGKLRLDDAQSAADNFREALREDAGHVGALSLLALQDAERGNVDAGEQLLRVAATREPKSVALASALAEYCRMARKTTEAEAEWRRVIALDPANVAALINLVDLLCSLGRTDESEELAKSLAQQSNSNYWQWHALLLLRKGQTDAAIAELQEISQRAPRDPIARLRLVAALISANRPQEAQALMDEAERNGDRTLDGMLMQAQLALIRDDPRAADAFVTQAAHFDPASGQPHLIAARLPENANNSFRIKYELGESLRLEPTLLSARLTLSRFHLSLRDGVNALAVLNESPKGQRSTYRLLLLRSWTLLATGEWTKASSATEALASMERSPELLAQQAVLEAALRNSPKVQATLTELTRISQPGSAATRVSKLLGGRAPSPEELRTAAMDLGSQPLWESYHADLLELPRGLLRSVLDPEGLLPLRTFGAGEPMIHES